MIRTVVAFVIAVAVALVAGATSLSWFDQASFLEAAGPAASLSIGERLAWFGQTLYGLTFVNGTGLGFGLYPVLVFVALLIGFGVKLPIVPLHNWLPDAHVEALWPVAARGALT